MSTPKNITSKGIAEALKDLKAKIKKLEAGQKKKARGGVIRKTKKGKK